MSASTRTLQQPLGFGQIGAALAVVAMVIVIAAFLAFGALGAAKTVAPEYGTPPDAAIDRGSGGGVVPLPAGPRVHPD